MMCTIKAPNRSRLNDFAQNIACADRQELLTCYPNQSIESVLHHYLHLDAFLAMLYHRDAPVAFFGCAFIDAQIKMGVPFLMTTDEVKYIKVAFVKSTHQYIRAFLDCCDLLFNYVDSRNQTHIDFLHHFGFSIDKQSPKPISNIDFYPFYKTAQMNIALEKKGAK